MSGISVVKAAQMRAGDTFGRDGGVRKVWPLMLIILASSGLRVLFCADEKSLGGCVENQSCRNKGAVLYSKNRSFVWNP